MVSAATCPSSARAGEKEAVQKGGDPNVCNFVLPGNFTDALAKAAEANRCLIIKGIAFGIDRVGATCATRGHW